MTKLALALSAAALLLAGAALWRSGPPPAQAPAPASVAAVAGPDGERPTDAAPRGGADAPATAEVAAVSPPTTVAPPEPTSPAQANASAPQLEEPAGARAQARAARPMRVGQGTPAARPVMTAPLPRMPERSVVLSALRRVAPDVDGCLPGTTAVAEVQVTFEGSSGRVQGALVSGALAGTAAGSCVARAVRSAQVPPFARERLVVSFPYRL